MEWRVGDKWQRRLWREERSPSRIIIIESSFDISIHLPQPERAAGAKPYTTKHWQVSKKYIYSVYLSVYYPHGYNKRKFADQMYVHTHDRGQRCILKWT